MQISSVYLQKGVNLDLYEKIMSLCMEGYHCSQVIAILMLETIGAESPDLVKALNGLGGGVGLSGNCCGCMTGGACTLAYFGGKGPECQEDPQNREMQKEFVDWFTEEKGSADGSVHCMDILGGDWNKRFELCPDLIAESYLKCMELLNEKGFVE